MKPTVTSQKAPLGILGEHLIDEAAVPQMKRAMELPVSIAGYLLPDAHVGYGIPIGGVWATRNAISPYAVGVDIGCRMQVTVFDAKEYAIPVKELRRAVQQHTVFGAGQTFRAGDRNSDPVLDSPEWTRHPWLKQNPKLLDTAREQLGTSGGGNHFINFGRVELPDGSEHLGMMTHSGSRGFGASVARHYSKLAQKLHPELPKDVIHLAWFELDSEEGQQYWRAMQLAGQYAAANHNVVHRRLSEHLGLAALDPRPDLGFAENFFHMCFGSVPEAEIVQAFEASLILYAEHSFNASTFTARVVASTTADLYSACTAAVGAL